MNLLEKTQKGHRKFKIKTLTGANDPAALKEVLVRRFKHAEWPLPQLLVVDGAVAQKNVAERTLKDFGLVIPVVAVVKDDRHRPTRLLGLSTLITKHQSAILLANAESHRFAIGYHRQKRNKNQLL